MKITRNSKEVSIEEAVADKLYPDAYTYDGQLEKLTKTIELQSEMIAKLVVVVFTNGSCSPNADKILELIGHDYEVKR